MNVDDKVKQESVVNSRELFAKNLKYYMQALGKTRREVSEALGISYFTFTDWCNGKKYPRPERVEALANYFGISVAELIGTSPKGVESPHQNVSSDILDVVVRLHRDPEFLALVQDISRLKSPQYKAVKVLLDAFKK